MTSSLASSIVTLAGYSFFFGGAIATLLVMRCIRDIDRERSASEERQREHERWLRRREESDEPWRFSTGD